MAFSKIDPAKRTQLFGTLNVEDWRKVQGEWERAVGMTRNPEWARIYDKPNCPRPFLPDRDLHGKANYEDSVIGQLFSRYYYLLRGMDVATNMRKFRVREIVALIEVWKHRIALLNFSGDYPERDDDKKVLDGLQALLAQCTE